MNLEGYIKDLVPGLQEKARACGSAEELLALAKEAKVPPMLRSAPQRRIARNAEAATRLARKTNGTSTTGNSIATTAVIIGVWI